MILSIALGVLGLVGMGIGVWYFASTGTNVMSVLKGQKSDKDGDHVTRMATTAGISFAAGLMLLLAAGASYLMIQTGSSVASGEPNALFTSIANWMSRSLTSWFNSH